MQYHYDLDVSNGERFEDIARAIHSGESVLCRDNKSISKNTLGHKDQLLFYYPESEKRFVKLLWHSPWAERIAKVRNPKVRITLVNAGFVRRTTYDNIREYMELHR